MKMRLIATPLLIGSFLLQPHTVVAEQPKAEDFTNFPIPTKGTEQDPKLVYEKENNDGSKTKITTSERETSMLVFGGVAVGLTLIAVVGTCIWSGKINLSEISRAVYGGNDSGK